MLDRGKQSFFEKKDQKTSAFTLAVVLAQVLPEPLWQNRREP